MSVVTRGQWSNDPHEGRVRKLAAEIGLIKIIINSCFLFNNWAWKYLGAACGMHKRPEREAKCPYEFCVFSKFTKINILVSYLIRLATLYEICYIHFFQYCAALSCILIDPDLFLSTENEFSFTRYSRSHIEIPISLETDKTWA